MDDLESWLRSAMAAAAQDPPAALVARIWHRRRLHLRRVGASCAAAVVAIAVAAPAAVHEAQRWSASKSAAHSATGQTGLGIAGAGGTGGQAGDRAVPGTVLVACPSYSRMAISGGEIGSHWQRSSVQIGPVWLVYAQLGNWFASGRYADGTLAPVQGVILAIKNGTTAELTTPPQYRARLRFLTRATASGRYTLRDGVAGLTLAACPAGPVVTNIPDGWAAGLTLFYLPLGYVTSLTGCVPFEVVIAPYGHPQWIRTVSLSGGRCTS